MKNVILTNQTTNLATKNTSDFTITETGDAFVSLRVAAKLCGVFHNSIVHQFKNKGDISQGLSPSQLSFVVHHYAVNKSKPEAIKTLVKLAEAGAKAWIYHEAGYQLDAKPTVPTMTLLEAAGHVVRLETLRIENEETILHLRSEAKIAKPKVECFDQIADSSNLIGMNDVAKTLNIKGLGRNNLFKLLKEKKILNYGNIPYQRFIESGYFEVKVSSYYDKHIRDNRVTQTTYVTGKGLTWLQKTVENNKSITLF